MASELDDLLGSENQIEDIDEPLHTKETTPFSLGKLRNILTKNVISFLFLLISAILIFVIAVVIITLVVRKHSNDDDDTCTVIDITKPSFVGQQAEGDDHSTSCTGSSDIIKPGNDRRCYKSLVLTNGLRVLLISDPSTTEAAAAMDVSAGSFNDPAGIDGLAHFCEHMLFLGTAKYPGKNEYSDFLSSHGGYDNAYTSTQNTNYYFSVESDVLEEALDRFAQFFIAPLFLATSTYDEMKAVNSEYDKDFNDPGWKEWQLLKNVSNPEHPFSRFNIGSLGTLNRSDIRTSLLKYYNQSYSANQMQLAVIGNDSLSVLEQWVNNKFSAVPNRRLQPLTFTATSFPPEYAGKLVFYAPGEPKHSATIFWQLPPLQDKYRNLVSSVLSTLLGDEGHGSVLEYLKRRQWASSLSASTEVDTDSYTIYTIDLTLTESGLQSIADVVGTVFQYIGMVQEASSTTWCGVWNEQIQLSAVLYDTKDKENPHSYVSSLASEMRIIKDPVDFLSPPSRAVFDVDLIKTALQHLTPANSIVFIGSPDLTGSKRLTAKNFPSPSLDQVEPWFNTSFARIDIPSEVLSMWGSYKDATGLSLPNPNQFLSGNLQMLPLDKGHSSIPTLIKNDTGLSVWWLQDVQYHVPKINFWCTIENPIAYDSARHYSLSDLLLSYVLQVMAADLYPATLAGYSKSFLLGPSGITIEVNGYSDTSVILRFLKAVLEGVHGSTSNVDETIFSLTKSSLIGYYKQFAFSQLPYRYVRSYVRKLLLQKPYWSHDDIVEELKNLTSKDLLKHANSLFSSASGIICLGHGNVLKQQVISLSETVKSTLAPSSSPAQSCGYEIAKIPEGTSNLAISPLNPKDKNSIVNVIFQVGYVCTVSDATKKCSNVSLKQRALAGLLQLIMKDMCFTYLRTVKQLGYVATCYYSGTSNVISFELLVQSGTFDPDTIYAVMEEFLQHYYDNELRNSTSAEMFDEAKSSYKKVLAVKKVSLQDKTLSLWAAIALRLYQFDINSQLENVVDSIGGTELRDFYNTHLLQPTHQKLVISMFGYPLVPHHLNGTVSIDYTFKEKSVDNYSIGC